VVQWARGVSAVAKFAACGCIMAGGRSTRMGTNKALLDFQGQRLIERIAGQFAAWFDQVVLVTNTPEVYAFLGLPMAGDRVPGLGPLGGIEAGLQASAHAATFMAACDMPFLQPDLIGYLLELSSAADVVVPLPGGEYEPMHAVYGQACLPAVRASLDAGVFKITRFYEKLRLRTVDDGELARFGRVEKLFFNCNTPADLEQALRLAQE